MVCFSCDVVFLLEGRGRLYSPILKELIAMLPKIAPILVVRYTAKHVARCTQYEEHTDQRGYWRALRKEWTRVVRLRAFGLFGLDVYIRAKG